MYIRNTAEKVVKCISNFVYIFIHEQSNILIIDMFHSQNDILYEEFVHVCSGLAPLIIRIALFCRTIISLR